MTRTTWLLWSSETGIALNGLAREEAEHLAAREADRRARMVRRSGVPDTWAPLEAHEVRCPRALRPFPTNTACACAAREVR